MERGFIFKIEKISRKIFKKDNYVKIKGEFKKRVYFEIEKIWEKIF